MEPLEVKTTSKLDAIEAITLIQSLVGDAVIHKGCGDEGVTPSEFLDTYYIKGGYWIILRGGSISGCGSNMGYDKYDYSNPEDVARLVKTLMKVERIIEVENVGWHTAKISERGVEVGDVRITFAKVEEIVAAIKEFKS